MKLILVGWRAWRAGLWFLWYRAIWTLRARFNRCKHPAWVGPVGGPYVCLMCAESGQPDG